MRENEIKLILGDCLFKLKDIPSDSIDLIVTSPPYDKLRTYNNTLEWDFNKFQDIASELYRVVRQGGVIVWVVGDATVKGSETGTSFKQALYFKEIGFNLHDTMIFEKNSMSMPDRVRYYQKFEYMFVFSKGRPKTFNPIKDHKNTAQRWSKKFNIYKPDGTQVKRERSLESNEYGVRFNIWKYNTGFGFTSKGNIKHPAMFPLQLAKDHIISWSNEGDTVLDPFAGSGTTGIACKELNRNFIGIEIVKEYFNIMQERVKDAKN